VTHVRDIGLYDLVVAEAQAQEHRFWQRYIDREAQDPYRWADDFPFAPNGLGVNHVALQEALIVAAANEGATVHRPAEATIRRLGDRLRISIESTVGQVEIVPRLLVGADGEHSATRRWLGGSMQADAMHHMLGGVLVEGLDLAPDRIHQAYFEGGFAFASPTAPDIARVYLVCSPECAMEIQRSPEPAESLIERFLAAMPEPATHPEYRVAGPAAFFPNATQVATIPSSRDTALIGDASGRNDPSQGHGLSLVFRDVNALRQMLLSDIPWTDVPDRFHAEKARDFEVLRQHAHWNERTATETGPEIDAIREGIARSRAADPTAGGFAPIFALGPSGLVADELARRHYFGEDLE
jgi:2-polyprenyl-6-methoxyphenol hydroxylase-like FAD-dependent oxidoreductase